MNPYPIRNGTQHNGGAPPRATREKVAFETNIPQVVTLEFDPPAEARDGNWGPQFMYFLEENRIMFAEPAVHEQILQLGCTRGATLAIVKRKNGRQNAWEVNQVHGGKFIAHEKPPVSAPRSHAPASAPRVQETAPPPLRAANESVGASGNLMAAALKEAMEAVALSGFEEASREDIRALAITIYIGTTGGKR